MSEGFRLYGDLNREVLERAANALVERHESLRTRFIQIDGSPVQIVDEVARVEVFYRRSQFTDGGEQGIIAALCQEERQTFDLSQAPMFRINLLKLGPQDHILQRTIHHIAADACRRESSTKNWSAFMTRSPMGGRIHSHPWACSIRTLFCSSNTVYVPAFLTRGLLIGGSSWQQCQDCRAYQPIASDPQYRLFARNPAARYCPPSLRVH
jgi:hypothetical protein